MSPPACLQGTVNSHFSTVLVSYWILTNTKSFLGCSPPSAITVGSGTYSPIKSVYSVGDIVTYACTSPAISIRSGQDEVTCGSDGKFSRHSSAGSSQQQQS